MKKELAKIESFLKEPENEWRWHATQVIAEVPSGYLATYGAIADAVNKRHGLGIIGRNVGWLRKKLYEKFTHYTEVPLHRIAKDGDVGSLHDSSETKLRNDHLRSKEGSLENPKWWCP